MASLGHNGLSEWSESMFRLNEFSWKRKFLLNLFILWRSASQTSPRKRCTCVVLMIRLLVPSAAIFLKISSAFFNEVIGSIMMASSNGNIFRVTGPLWGESTGHRWFPSQRPVTLFCLIYTRWSKQSRRRWFETPSRSLWHRCNCDTESPALAVLTHWDRDKMAPFCRRCFEMYFLDENDCILIEISLIW